MLSKIVFITKQKEFSEDVQMAYWLKGDKRYELKCCYAAVLDMEYSDIEKMQPDLIVFTSDMASQIKKYRFKAPSVCIQKEGSISADTAGYETAAVVEGSSETIDLLSSMVDDSENRDEMPAAKKQGGEKASAKQAENENAPVKNENRKKTDSDAKGALTEEDEDDPFAEKRETPLSPKQEEKKTEAPKKTRQEPIKAEKDITKKAQEDLETYEEDDEFSIDAEYSSDESSPKESKSMKKDKETDDLAEEGDYLDKEIEKDIIGEHGKTKIITVYSAKGGVGKTKVSTELAVLLSLVEAGSRRFRVCEVDCNIDFGDVRSTLKMEAKGPNMSFWADEIREKIDSGHMKPQDITYTKEEIERWLRHDPKSGLYVLAAPLTNEDSFIVNETAMRVMFMNLIRYGDFDFIVCDTGNNTRDTSMVALELADDILLLMTQDVNTANCNRSFLKMMKDVDFDVSKVKLVVNKIKPLKATKISVEDIENYFEDYHCVARIKYSPDVEVSTNEGEPLAYDPDNDFTKQIRGIVSYVIGDTDFEEEKSGKKEKKHRGLGFLFKKKRK